MSDNLEENIKLLNKKYDSLNIQFELDGDIIKIKEDYIIANDPKLKQALKKEYSISFDWDQKFWFIGKVGIKKLSVKKVKIEPYKSISTLKRELFEYVKMIKKEELNISLKKFFETNEIFFESSGAKFYHHNYKGGLLEHTIQTVKIALAMNNVLDKNIIIDQDLLIAGAILHDIGKINCYEYYNGMIEITDIYKEQEHIINGIKIISQEIKTKELDKLIHIVASHHNTKEWGSPIEPITNEAWIIHFAENLSSKIMG